MVGFNNKHPAAIHSADKQIDLFGLRPEIVQRGSSRPAGGIGQLRCCKLQVMVCCWMFVEPQQQEKQTQAELHVTQPTGRHDQHNQQR